MFKLEGRTYIFPREERIIQTQLFDPIEGWERRLTSITHVVHKAYLPESVSTSVNQ